jgi:hypothetical protein
MIYDEPEVANRGDGWVRIGQVDGAGTRALWARVQYMGPDRILVGYGGEECGIDSGPCVSIELCGGRNGSDEYVRLTPSNMDPVGFSLLLGVVTAQMWALSCD